MMEESSLYSLPKGYMPNRFSTVAYYCVKKNTTGSYGVEKATQKYKDYFDNNILTQLTTGENL